MIASRLGILMVLEVLAGCVNSMYHAAGAPPAVSAYEANKLCLPEVESVAFQQPLVPGLLPALMQMSGPAGQAHQNAVNVTQDACMARYGWARN